ncbi:LamG domain-containing protein [Myxococcota bacterium]
MNRVFVPWLLVGGLLMGCSGGSSDGASDWDYRNGIPGLRKGGNMSDARYSPRGGTCPADAPLVCQDLCCPADQECAEDGCVAPAVAPGCAPDETFCPAAECAGGICLAADSGVHGNDATVQSPAEFVSGKFGLGVTPGRELSLDCQNDPAPVDIRAPGTGFPRIHQAKTIEAWIKVDPDKMEGTQVIIAHREGLMPDTVFDNMWAVTLGAGGLGIERGIWGGLEACSMPVTYDGLWHHVAVASNGGGGLSSTDVEFYWDGSVLGACQLPSINIPPIEGNTAVYIGQQPVADEYGRCYQPLQGVLDELRVTARVLTAAEIMQDAAAELSIDEYPPATSALWHFDDRMGFCCPAVHECSPQECNSIDPSPLACPAWAPLRCGPEYCCGFGTGCLEIAAGEFKCVTARPDPPPLDPDPETGCYLSHPVPCGDFCCLFDATCRDGDCGCPPGQAECEALCCAEGIDCIDGHCQGDAPCPDEDYPVECGDRECCATGFECVDGSCTCSGEYPVDCGPFCCLPGASCDYTRDFCSCPGGRQACGFMDLYCCADGYECKDDKCVKKEGGNGTCPGGWMGSTQSCGAVGTSDPCNCIGETNICITKTMYEEGTGLPFPPGCAADGTTGCLNNMGILVNPCCPGLTCVYRERCGGPGDGICKEYP